MAQEELQESKLTKAGGRKPTHGCNYPMVGWPSVILTPMGPSLHLTREGTSRPSLRSSLSLSQMEPRTLLLIWTAKASLDLLSTPFKGKSASSRALVMQRQPSSMTCAGLASVSTRTVVIADCFLQHIRIVCNWLGNSLQVGQISASFSSRHVLFTTSIVCVNVRDVNRVMQNSLKRQ